MNYAQLHEDICFKRANGLMIWQPRIDCWIDDRLFRDGQLPEPYRGMCKVQLYQKLGCSARIYEYNECFFPLYDHTIEHRIFEEDNLRTECFETPLGKVTRVEKTTKSSWAKLVAKQWVCSEEDLKIFTYIEEHTTWGFSQEAFNRIKSQWGDLGAPCIYMPRVSLQRLYIDLMGVEEAVYALADYPNTVKKYFEALRECHIRLIHTLNRSPINLINFGDNIHSGTLSPKLFKEFVLPEYQLRTELLHQGGKFVYSHFDGDNRGLMEFYKETGLDGIEAITPKPQGDVTLDEVRKYMDGLVLLDGIPAIYFDETYSIETLIDFAHQVINLFAPNLVLGISDEISSNGDLERVKIVGNLVKEYNQNI